MKKPKMSPRERRRRAGELQAVARINKQLAHFDTGLRLGRGACCSCFGAIIAQLFERGELGEMMVLPHKECTEAVQRSFRNMKKGRKSKSTELAITSGDDGMLYLVADGRRIARRSPGESWVTLEPGWIVRGGEPGIQDTIVIEHDPRATRLQ
jgi:hypothetical protein